MRTPNCVVLAAVLAVGLAGCAEQEKQDAQSTQVAVVDVPRAANEHGLVQQINGLVSAYEQELGVMLRNLRDRLQKEVDEIQAKQVKLQEGLERSATREKDRQEIARMGQEVMTKVQAMEISTQSAQQAVAQYRRNLDNVVLTQVKPLISEIGAERKIKMILLHQVPVYSDPDIDLTAELTKKLSGKVSELMKELKDLPKPSLTQQGSAATQPMP